jgi:hypothetical protein
MDSSICEIDIFGNKWWTNGKDQLHHIGGPAIERSDGSKEWWVNGYPHNTNGPAILWANGYRAWYVNGKKLTEQEFNDLQLKQELEELFTL